jgi:hypothetical protein
MAQKRHLLTNVHLLLVIIVSNHYLLHRLAIVLPQISPHALISWLCPHVVREAAMLATLSCANDKTLVFYSAGL